MAMAVVTAMVTGLLRLSIFLVAKARRHTLVSPLFLLLFLLHSLLFAIGCR